MTDPRPLFVLGVLNALEPGGCERDTLRFMKAWQDAGLDARLVVGRWEGPLRAEAPDIPYIIPPKGRLAKVDTEALWMMTKLPGIVRELRPDVLFLPMNGMMSVAVVVRLLLGRDCPPIVLRISNSLDERHSSPFQRFVSRFVMRAHSGIYAALVAMAEPVRAEVILEMGARPEQVVVINNGSMTAQGAARLAALRDATPRDHKGRHFLAIGRLVPQKNFPLLLDAFARIARPDDRLTILGEGAQRIMLRDKAEALGIADRLDMPGHLIPVDDWLARADAFILSSDFEGVPAVVAEALAAGLPVVATDCTVAMPFMLEGVGRLIPIKDLDALAGAMDAICDDPLDLAAMRARAALFTIDSTVERWIALFRRIAQK